MSIVILLSWRDRRNPDEEKKVVLEGRKTTSRREERATEFETRFIAMVDGGEYFLPLSQE
jgi:hypothetical protein